MLKFLHCLFLFGCWGFANGVDSIVSDGADPSSSSVAVNFPRRSSVMDTMRNLRASTLVELLDKTGIAEVMHSSGPYTIFAPTDDAFERLSRASRRQLEKDPTLLRTLLLSHVVPGRYASRDLRDEQRLKTASNTSLAVRIFADRKPRINHASVTLTDAMASNGVVHVVGDVLYPPATKSMMDLVRSCPKLTTLAALLEKAGFEQALGNTTREVGATLFAPTDDAFRMASPEIREKLFGSSDEDVTAAAITNGRQLLDTGDLLGVLLHHVVQGTHYSSTFKDNQQVVTEGESEFDVGLRGHRLRDVGPARVLKSDLAAVNGVVHLIDRLMEPYDDYC